MAKSSAQFEARLKAVGKWSAFHRRVDELVGGGKSLNAAQMAATREFTSHAQRGREKLEDAAETKRAAESGAGDETSRSIILQPVSLEAFSGKRAEPTECVEWVARHLAIDDVTPEMAPDSTAWAMLMHIRANPQAEYDFWKSTFPKLIRADLIGGDDDEDDFDGKDEVDFVQELIEMGEAARKPKAVETAQCETD